MEYIIIQMVIYIKENGKMIQEMEMGYIIIKMEIYMKANGKTIKLLDLV